MVYERIVKRFYDELENGKIMGRRCLSCGAVEFPPVLACNECSGLEMEWIEMSGNATLETLVMPSIMSILPEYAAIQPYAFGAVKTEEGALINGIIRGVDPARENELKRSLPLPLKMAIVPMDGYHTVIYDLVEED